MVFFITFQCPGGGGGFNKTMRILFRLFRMKMLGFILQLLSRESLFDLWIAAVIYCECITSGFNISSHLVSEKQKIIFLAKAIVENLRIVDNYSLLFPAWLRDWTLCP